MDHHARVLQQRIEVAAVGRRGQQALERVRGDEDEEQEAEGEPAHHGQDAGHDLLGQVPAESETAKVQNVSISSHSRIEPSWPPHTAVKR